MKNTYTHYLLIIFVLISTISAFSQNGNKSTKLGADIMFTIFEATGGGPNMVLLLQKKDGTEVSLKEFNSFSYQDKPGVPEGFKELKLEHGNYTFDNFFQRADFDYYGRYSKGRFTLFFHPITVILDVEHGQIMSKSWYEFSETDLKIEFEEYFDNGKISARGFIEKDGSKTGEWKHYNKEDGHLSMSGEYENDKRVGVWKVYDSKGKVKEEVNFSKKSKVNAFEYFSKQQKN